MSKKVWILGATGRTGGAIAVRLDAAGVPLVLVGRNRERLEGVAATHDGAPRLVAASLPEALAQLRREPPAVVVNTVGPFTATAPQVTAACPPGTHYVDLSNELASAEAVLGLDRQAAGARQSFVTGAGFGVLATESVVQRLCEGRPRPASVRVDALASVATGPGRLGTALAASIVEVLRHGGREVRQGHLVRSRFAAGHASLATPDGDVLGTAGGPSAELLAAWRASGADSVVSASSAAPGNALARLLLPLAGPILRIPGAGGFAVRRMAATRLTAKDLPRPHSWGHARVEWPGGTVLEGWLRAGDAMDFTVAAATEVVLRLLNGAGRPGAHTPGALFGPGLAEAAGGKFLAG